MSRRATLIASALETVNTLNARSPFLRNGYPRLPSFAAGLPTSGIPVAPTGRTP